jgi:hypothetical protein
MSPDNGPSGRGVVLQRIDAIQTGIPERSEFEKNCREDIIKGLKKKGGDETLLLRLRIDFLDADTRQPRPTMTGNDDLSLLKVAVFEEFGPEILRSLDLSLSD